MGGGEGEGGGGWPPDTDSRLEDGEFFFSYRVLWKNMKELFDVILMGGGHKATRGPKDLLCFYQCCGFGCR